MERTDKILMWKLNRMTHFIVKTEQTDNATVKMEHTDVMLL
jgi:hypothetical protein